jgi:GNAT superfamily N-acetyltransferase
VTAQIRRGTADDLLDTFRVFHDAVRSLGATLGVSAFSAAHDAPSLEDILAPRRPLFEHLTEHAAEFWVAEEERGVVGYARSILRDDVLQLTEFFVHPDTQSRGLGRELLARAFPMDRARRHIIIATIDRRALARYLKTGMAAYFPIYPFIREARAMSADRSLEAIPLSPDAETLDALAALDHDLLGYRRDPEHEFLTRTRAGFLYRRGRALVGYGYVGFHSGPFAAVSERDLPAMLRHGEGVAATRGHDFEVEVPLINPYAVQYLLSEGFRMEPFVNYFLSSAPPGRFDHYLVSAPSFFV